MNTAPSLVEAIVVTLIANKLNTKIKQQVLLESYSGFAARKRGDTARSGKAASYQKYFFPHGSVVLPISSYSHEMDETMSKKTWNVFDSLSEQLAGARLLLGIL
jgi:hypothetical protein